MTLQELEQAITSLPNTDLEAFARWFEEFLADAWDRKIEADAASGRLDEAFRRAAADVDGGRTTPL
jgi:hypothetical protein